MCNFAMCQNISDKYLSLFLSFYFLILNQISEPEHFRMWRETMESEFGGGKFKHLFRGPMWSSCEVTDIGVPQKVLQRNKMKMISMFLSSLDVTTSIAITIIVPDALISIIINVLSICISQHDNAHFLVLFSMFSFCGKITLNDVHNKGFSIYADLVIFFFKNGYKLLGF